MCRMRSQVTSQIGRQAERLLILGTLPPAASSLEAAVASGSTSVGPMAPRPRHRSAHGPCRPWHTEIGSMGTRPTGSQPGCFAEVGDPGSIPGGIVVAQWKSIPFSDLLQSVNGRLKFALCERQGVVPPTDISSH